MSAVNDPNRKCLICGENRATGYWHGTMTEIYVCGECAAEVLPQLIADATLGVPSTDRIPDRGKAILETVQKRFWYAATCLANRRRKNGATSAQARPQSACVETP